MSYLMPTYAPLPVEFTKGEGVYLWDTNNTRYLDALSGIAVCNLGHAHPTLVKALHEQSQTLWHTSNLYHIGAQEALAKRLCELARMEQAFFCNSGAEANETAIKLAKRYGINKGIENPKIIVMEGAFHGRTFAALTATGNDNIKQGFGPLAEGFIRVPFDDLASIEQLAKEHDDIAAILVEPVQGEGGVNPLSTGFLIQVKTLCEQNDWLLMCDEIQSGIARTGHWFGHQHDGIVPDVMTLAKGLGNGIPIGACLANNKASNVLTAGTHGTTFGGTPIACSVALAVLDVIEQNHILDNVSNISTYLAEQFKQRLDALEGVVMVRNRGLMIGIELNQPCTELVKRALLEKQLLINVTQQRVIRLLPPLIFNQQHADELVDSLCPLIISFLGKHS